MSGSHENIRCRRGNFRVFKHQHANATLLQAIPTVTLLQRARLDVHVQRDPVQLEASPTATAVRPLVPVLGTILCAVDSSPAAKAVLYTGGGLAANPASKLVVIHVTDRLKSNDEQRAMVALNERALQTIPGWIAYREETELVVRSGHPADTILAVAEERGANLIVIGTHSRRAVPRLVSGSATASVLKKAKVPVAVVPPSGPELISLTDTTAVPHLGSVLVPVDLRGGSARQLAFASMLSLASQREVTLLHAIPANADSVEPLHKLREMAGCVDSRTGAVAIVTHGPVVDVVLDRQKRAGAGIIVLGRDAKSPGHVAFELLEKSRAVVVFVP